MTALEKLRAEPTPFADMSVEEWERALLTVATKQVTDRDVLSEHGNYWLTLTGTLWVLLFGENDPVGTPTPKFRAMAQMVRAAIEDLGVAAPAAPPDVQAKLADLWSIKRKAESTDRG